MYEKYIGQIQHKRLVVGPWPMNCYVLICPEFGQSAVIDPGAEPDRILEALEGTMVKVILFTHGHPDHSGALMEVQEATGAPVAIHALDAERLPLPADFELRDGDVIAFGEECLRVLHTPGHTPGSVCFLCGDILIAGDTLFPGGPGHTDDAQAFQQILSSIQEKIFPLPDETVVYPGHGDPTTVGQARAEYALFAAQPHPEDLHGDVTWLPLEAAN